MSDTSLVQLEKKRSELENELSSTAQKEATLEKELRMLEEEVAAQLEEKIQAKYAAVERLESTKGSLERRLKELREHQKTSQMPEEPMITGVEPEEQKPKQTEAAGVDGQENHIKDVSSEDNVKRCSSCGAENKTDAVFCEKCGKRVE